MKSIRKHSVVIAVLLMLICVGVTLYALDSNPYHSMLQTGLIPSYTERVYVIGDDETAPGVRYVPLGDSLTAGVGADRYIESYPYLLAQHLYEKKGTPILLQPHAIPGITTGNAIVLLLDKVVALNPDRVTILLGVNDVHKGVSAETFTYNYEYILQRLMHETHATLSIINIPYIGASDLIVPPESDHLRARTVEFNGILRVLAGKYNLPYIDLYTPALEQSDEAGYYADDRFHPSGVGYTLWAHTLYDHFD